ncbi:hypothetical protein ACQ4PT_030184 [Festuca glaucescens]
MLADQQRAEGRLPERLMREDQTPTADTQPDLVVNQLIHQRPVHMNIEVRPTPNSSFISAAQNLLNQSAPTQPTSTTIRQGELAQRLLQMQQEKTKANEDKKLAILEAKYAADVKKAEEAAKKKLEQEKRKAEQAQAKAREAAEKREKRRQDAELTKKAREETRKFIAEVRKESAEKKRKEAAQKKMEAKKLAAQQKEVQRQAQRAAQIDAQRAHRATHLLDDQVAFVPQQAKKGTESGGGSDNDIISWSGPKKPPMTPICCDEPISFIQPVFRIPRRTTNAAANEENVNQKIQEPDDKDNNKRKRNTPTSRDDDDEEDIMCWSGPPKKPRSPIKCTKEIFATNTTFRLPRKRQSASTFETGTAGLFCHHVIAVFEHLRLDEIPSRYILKRYTKDAVTNPDFNRRDYMTTTDDGTSIEYRRTILYSEAVKIINKGCSSEAKFEIALSAFRDANSCMDNEDTEMENNEQSSNQDDTTRETGEQNDIPPSDNNDPYADIQPPLVAKTKGSKTTDATRNNEKCKPPAPARPQPELDENGKPKGIWANNIFRKCQGAHKKLARQHIPETEDEEMLDTDEGECFEDETDDEEYENKDEDEDISEQEQTHTTPDVDNKLESINKKEGQRKCSVCNLRQGHYASTCPYKDKILQQQIHERKTSDSVIVKPQGVKACGTCNKIRGHNSRTCARRQLEEQLFQLQSTENDSNNMEDSIKEKKNRKKTQTPPAAIRRSTRNR